MDKLDKSYYWHITTLAKMKLRQKECKKELVHDRKSKN